MVYQLHDRDFVLIRHAPVSRGGFLFGRTDASARLPAETALSSLRERLSLAQTRISSPALRCRQTAAALWGEENFKADDPDLLEQDFGDWEGLPYADLPNIGDLSGEALAAHAAPNGESFNEVCARAIPVLLHLAASQPGPTAAVVHAGIVRAFLAHAIGSAANALKFEVDCLSISRFRLTSGGEVVVRDVNTSL